MTIASTSPFGDLMFGDEQGLAYWQQNHNDSHYTYAMLAPQAGQYVDLTSQIDENWFFQHLLMHRGLSNLVLAGASYVNITKPVAIDVSAWTDPEMFYWWQAQHNDMHRALDMALGVT